MYFYENEAERIWVGKSKLLWSWVGRDTEEGAMNIIKIHSMKLSEN